MNLENAMTSYIDRLLKAFQLSNRQIQMEMSISLKELNLTGPQFYILYLLSLNNGTKSTELAEQLEVKPSAITVMIDRLIKNEYVMRERDEKDRRIVKLDLTSKGEEVLGKAKNLRKEIFQRYLSYLDEGEVEKLVEIYEKLAFAIQEKEINHHSEERK